ncbi:MAG: polysaccharide biosynthesis/export family protein [Pseudomonadota bacterium]
MFCNEQKNKFLNLIIVVFSVVSCANRAPISPTPTPPLPPADTRVTAILEPGDVLVIRVFAENDLSGNYQIADNGTFDFPLVGRVKAAGLTPPQLASLLKKGLSNGMLKDPHVSVFVPQYKEKRNFVVWGEVNRPGTYEYKEGMSIIRALTTAGGLKPIANQNGITVTRMVNGKLKTFTVPVFEGESANYPIQLGDVIFVPERVF